MKLATKILLIAGASILTLGIVVTVVGMKTGKNVFENVEYVKKSYDFSDDISNIKIAETSHDIKILKSDDSDIHVTCYDSDNYRHEVKVEGDTLRIEYEGTENKAHWYQYITFNISFTDDKDIHTEVMLPEDAYDKLDLDASSADVYVDQCFTFNDADLSLSSGDTKFDADAIDALAIKASSGEVFVNGVNAKRTTIETSSGDISASALNGNEVKINASSGEIKVDSITADSVKIETTSGDIMLRDLSSSKECSVEATSGTISVSNGDFGSLTIGASSGDISLSDGTCSIKAYLKATSGDIVLNECKTAVLELHTSSGDFTFKNLEVSDNANIETTSGEVNGTVIGDYFYDAHSSSGDIKIPSSEKVDQDIKISTSSGDITIKQK